MRDDELHRFKTDIPLPLYAAERYGYQRDRRESSVESHVLRHPGTDDKIIARRDQDGHWTYFSIRDDRDHGTIVDFVQRRGGHRSLGDVRQELRQWLGTSGPVPECAPAGARSAGRQRPSVADAFAAARVVPTCNYLSARGLRRETLGDPRFAGTWREDRRGGALFVHRDDAGEVTGFEIKSRGFTGFAAGGIKATWQSEARPTDRVLVVTESAIDALSYHQLHRDKLDDRARYLSTAGAPSRRQFERLTRVLAGLPSASTVVAAVDADDAGHKLARQLEAIARDVAGLGFRRDVPVDGKDWNDVLQRVERDRLRGRSLGRPQRGSFDRDR
jgi:hypothetical protein